jgi:hypothetical protein
VAETRPTSRSPAARQSCRGTTCLADKTNHPEGLQRRHSHGLPLRTSHKELRMTRGTFLRSQHSSMWTTRPKLEATLPTRGSESPVLRTSRVLGVRAQCSGRQERCDLPTSVSSLAVSSAAARRLAIAPPPHQACCYARRPSQFGRPGRVSQESTRFVEEQRRAQNLKPHYPRGGVRAQCSELESPERPTRGTTRGELQP